MQADLSANEPLLDIEVIGVNWAGLEAGNSDATESKSIPWLQDVDLDADQVSDAWANWGAEHLDLVVLDGHNEPLAKTTLIGAGLDQQVNYSSLRETLVDMALASQKPWHNSEEPLDVDDNGMVIPRDVLMIVNRLNSTEPGKLPSPGIPQSPWLFYDTNADGDLTALDALLVINFLNEQSPAGEGESAFGVHATVQEARSLDELQASPVSAAASFNGSLLDPEFDPIVSTSVCDSVASTDELTRIARIGSMRGEKSCDRWAADHGDSRDVDNSIDHLFGTSSSDWMFRW